MHRTRSLKPTSILTDAEVRATKARLEEILPIAALVSADLAVDLEITIRFAAVAAKCRESRELRGESIKDVAAQLRVPQYRLKAIEEPRAAEIDAEMLRRYIGYLGLGSWFSRWKRANRILAQSLDLTP